MGEIAGRAENDDAHGCGTALVESPSRRGFAGCFSLMIVVVSGRGDSLRRFSHRE